jgi:hypothetical protein
MTSEIAGFIEGRKFLHVQQRKENGEKLKEEMRR